MVPSSIVSYGERKQYTSLNSVWEAMVAKAQKVDCQQIKKLIDPMNGRLMTVLERRDNILQAVGEFIIINLVIL